MLDMFLVLFLILEEKTIEYLMIFKIMDTQTLYFEGRFVAAYLQIKKSSNIGYGFTSTEHVIDKSYIHKF